MPLIQCVKTVTTTNLSISRSLTILYFALDLYIDIHDQNSSSINRYSYGVRLNVLKLVRKQVHHHFPPYFIQPLLSMVSNQGS